MWILKLNKWPAGTFECHIEGCPGNMDFNEGLHRRPSYLGEGVYFPQVADPQPIDDLRTNLAEKFLLLGECESDTNQKNVLDDKENMQVYLRVRPFTALEIEQNEAQECVTIPDACSVLVKAPQSSQACRLSEKGFCLMAQKFTFTQVFGPETTQTQFFEGTMRQQVIDFMKGQNRLLFTYGVTNAGKTFTFQGTKDDAGILPRTMDMLFNTIQGKVYTKMDVKPHRCRDYIRLTKDQVKTEVALKNSVLRQIKEVDPQCSIRSNNSRTSADTTDFLNDDGFANSSKVLTEVDERLKQAEELKSILDSSSKYSVWVSFCEIYNECIFDLLDPISGDKFYKRKTLKLAQDIKGFSFVKDLQWIQVSDAKEACRILTLGKKFQSIAFTKLNSSSSRSHSIFTVRLLKIEDSDIPRVVKVSELALCDLAGSERCTKTKNEGERLKESGNINTSLLILGKCINALKNSQQSKAHQHVPFRESKLTHYLQSFFTGKGKVSMIVNICQSASSYDETLNVLKFSAVAQKVLILESSQNVEGLSHGLKKSAREVSFIINNADSKIWASRKRATVQWDSHLEDVQEDGDKEEFTEDFEEEECLDCTNLEDEDDDEEEEDDILIKKDAYQKLLDLVEDLKTQLVNEKKDKILMELKIREEVVNEFTQHFKEREKDFSERLEKEKELMEERCDERLEIFQDLVKKCTENEDGKPKTLRSETVPKSQVDENSMPLQGLFTSMQTDLSVIKKQAVEAHIQIAAIPDIPDFTANFEERLKQVSADLSKTQEELKKKSAELEIQIDQWSQTNIRLEEADKKLLSQRQQLDQLMEMIQQKESAIDKLKDLVSHWEAKCEDYERSVSAIRGEMAKASDSASVPVGRKRAPEDQSLHEDQPPSKKEHFHIDANISTDIIQTYSQNIKEESNIIQELEADKEKLKNQTITLNEMVTLLEKKLAINEEQLMAMESKNNNITSELKTYKELASNLEDTVKMLTQAVEQNKQNIANKVAKMQTIQNKLDEFDKSEVKESSVDFWNLNASLEDTTKTSLKNCSEVNLKGGQTGMVDTGRESTFYSAVEGLWRKCQLVLQESTKRKALIQQLEQKVDHLNHELAFLKNENNNLQCEKDSNSVKESLVEEKTGLIGQLQSQLSEMTNQVELKRKQELLSEKEILTLKNQVDEKNQNLMEKESLLDTYKSKCEKLDALEEQIKVKASAVQTLEKQLEENLSKHNEEKIKLEKKITDVQGKLTDVKNSANLKQKTVDQLTKETELLKQDLSQRAAEVKNLQIDLQRREEDYIDLKDKLADAKKQIQQVEKEVCAMREEKKLLSNKVNEYEKLKNQMSCDLEMKQRTIQQLKKEHLNKDTKEEAMKACQDGQAKEKIIEDMKLTLLEQEQTQLEQEQALEAKTGEVEKLSEELDGWRLRCLELEKNSQRGHLIQLSSEKTDKELIDSQVSKLQNQLKEFEEKYNSDRKKWLEEKMNLLAQAKESESHRNKEMRKFADDRERYSKQQGEVEQLSAQLAEKDNALLKWREERDQLVSALEVQLKSLFSSNLEKEKEIEQLKKSSGSKTEGENVDELMKKLATSEDTIKDLQEKLTTLRHCNTLSTVGMEDQVKVQPIKNVILPKQNDQLQSATSATSAAKSSDGSNISTEDCQSQDGSATVLDSSEISTENGNISRFPKPQMEICFSPARPNKMEVKHCGEDSSRTVKISRTTRKRKSHEMDQDIVKSENKKNAITKSGVRTPSSQSSPAVNKSEIKRNTLKKQPSTSSTVSSRKKEGTLQKLGDFLQSSPSIFQTKAKKLLETISAPKTTDLTVSRKENENKPKKIRRKLYNTDISAPLDFLAPPTIMDKNDKESDHLIMKRRLRTRTAK
ncbi:kinesin KIF20B [Pelobates cultripes]|uniref:Kinesin KIF20B n=2 Tax=Pelobates cultripes TaxID=61616 RepID=A0AAD1TEY9_PELCU|nr:kinesin KIF20B [Pelobates cultripes]